MKKYLRVADLRDFEMMLNKGEVTYSRAVEILNEKIHDQINKTRISKRLFPLTKKMENAEKEANLFFEKHGIRPSYSELANILSISKSACYYRMKHLRHLMISHK